MRPEPQCGGLAQRRARSARRSVARARARRPQEWQPAERQARPRQSARDGDRAQRHARGPGLTAQRSVRFQAQAPPRPRQGTSAPAPRKIPWPRQRHAGAARQVPARLRWPDREPGPAKHRPRPVRPAQSRAPQEPLPTRRRPPSAANRQARARPFRLLSRLRYRTVRRSAERARHAVLAPAKHRARDRAAAALQPEPQRLPLFHGQIRWLAQVR